MGFIMLHKNMTKDEVEDLFTYHTPDQSQRTAYDNIRTLAKSFAVTINVLCPDSEAKKTALIRLREAAMWANTAISYKHE